MKNFSIAFVLDTDLPNRRNYKSSTGFDTDCPFCGKKRKMNININKNLWRCNACGEGGNALQLHAKLCNISTKEAYQDLWKKHNKLPSDVISHYKEVKYVIPEKKMIDIEMRDKIYRTILDKLSLSNYHLQSLIKRGLTYPQVKELMYKSVPEKDMDVSFILDDPEIRDYIRKHKNFGIAGLYNLQNKPMLVGRRKGYLIPILVRKPLTDFEKQKFDNEDLISGFQIRYDKDEPRYTYLTSNDKEGGMGFSGAFNIHFRLPKTCIDDSHYNYETNTGYLDFDKPEYPSVGLTEGCNKSNIASMLSGCNFPFIAIQGVNNQRGLTAACKFLKSHYKTKEIILMFDEDYATNPNVAKALKEAKNKILASGLSVREFHWANRYAKGAQVPKGIDDFMLDYRKRTLKGTAKK